MPVHPVLPHESGGERGVEVVEHVVLVGVERVRESRYVEPATDHAGEPQRLGGRLGQPGDPTGEHVVHRSGRVLLRQQRTEIAAVAGEAGVLDEEERVAVGPLPQGLGLGRGGRCVRHGRDDLAGLLGGEAGQLEPERVPPGQHVRDLRELPGGRRFVAPGHDDHQSTGLGRLGEQPQHPQGGGVRPVQVVEKHEQVPLGCLLGDGARDRLPRPEPGRVVAPLCPGVRRELVAQSLRARWPRGRAEEHRRPGSTDRRRR